MNEEYAAAMADLRRALHAALDPLFYRVIGWVAVLIGALLWLAVTAWDWLRGER